MRSLALERSCERPSSCTQNLLRPVPSRLVVPFCNVYQRKVFGSARRLACSASEASAEPVASAPDIPDVDKQLVAEKAQKGMHQFAASTRKVGASRLVVDSLKRVSLTFLGEDHELNYAVAQIVGSRLGWFPVDVAKVICGMRKVASLDQLSKEDRAATEAELLHGLRNQYRVISTPYPGGAVAAEATWRDLWGSVVVWIDEEDKLRPKPRTPERALYESKAEVTVRVKVQKGFAVKGGNTLKHRSKEAAEKLLQRLSDHLAEFPQLADRKRDYVERGCRGDWPNVQPAEWSPVVQSLAADRKPLAGFEQVTPEAQQPVPPAAGPAESEAVGAQAAVAAVA